MITDMQVVTRQQRADKAAENFRAWVNQISGKYRTGHEEICSNLAALNNSPNPDDVDRIIGNDTWTKIYCASCFKNVNEAVLVIEADEGDKYMCFRCIRKAYRLTRNPGL